MSIETLLQNLGVYIMTFEFLASRWILIVFSVGLSAYISFFLLNDLDQKEIKEKVDTQYS